MDLVLLADIYGFGSYFKGSITFNDIDILIVHNSNEHVSCLDAISLKKKLVEKVDKVSITMLSRSEEAGLNFVNKASAKYLLSYDGSNLSEIVSAIEVMKPTEQ
ncbi:hypothetical protein ACA724_004532 [Vibrio parahaemolyticus]|nr:hypothetical protein [Vibrio parahaemolyticus]KIT50497.1 hypothetical protein H337_23525 [Vibrio parahaemolyticus EN9701121]EGW0146678.1 hypothetical protein [Vibrio parahaemolyticus]EHB9912037.1 hypothetical protein [Vibrio parahaemolyticus]EIA1794431.1 hypothetical protein [Vibrio parahaemolyticus]